MIRAFPESSMKTGAFPGAAPAPQPGIKKDQRPA